MDPKIVRGSIFRDSLFEPTISEKLSTNKRRIKETLSEATASLFSVRTDGTINARGSIALASKQHVKIERIEEDGKQRYLITIPRESELKAIPSQISRAVDSLNGTVASEQ